MTDNPYVIDKPIIEEQPEEQSKDYVRPPQKELEILRMSVARIAQHLNTETEKLPVVKAGFKELCDMVRQDRGWNQLCAEIINTLAQISYYNEMISNQLNSFN